MLELYSLADPLLVFFRHALILMYSLYLTLLSMYTEKEWMLPRFAAGLVPPLNKVII